MAFQTHDELDIHAFGLRKLSQREDDSIYIFLYIEAQPIDSDSEQSWSSKVPCFKQTTHGGKWFTKLSCFLPTSQVG